MLFLLNDTVLKFDLAAFNAPVGEPDLASMTLETITHLGAELYAANPTLQRTDPAKAEKLAYIIHTRWPAINAALFIARVPGCHPSQVTSRYADVALDVIGSLHRRQSERGLTAADADEAVWRRLAA